MLLSVQRVTNYTNKCNDEKKPLCFQDNLYPETIIQDTIVNGINKPMHITYQLLFLIKF